MRILGVDCRTEIALNRLNLKRFSYVFGNINSKNLSNVNFHVQDNFKLLLNNKHHVCINADTNLFMAERSKYRPRIFYINYDNVDDFRDTTFAHHDLSLQATQQHFKRAVDTFNKINNKNIPTLYVCMRAEN